MDFINDKKSLWIVVLVLILAVGAAIYSGVKALQGRPAPPPLTAPSTSTGTSPP